MHVLIKFVLFFLFSNLKCKHKKHTLYVVECYFLTLLTERKIFIAILTIRPDFLSVPLNCFRDRTWL